MKTSISKIISAGFGLVIALPALACMPPTPENTLLARLDNIEPSNNVQSYTQEKHGYLLDFSHPSFIFKSLSGRAVSRIPNQFEATFNPKNVKPHDLVMALADYYDGGHQENYRIYAIAPVTCQNNRIELGKPILAPDNPGWNRQTHRCGVSNDTGILDGTLGDKSQTEYLAEIQAKYPTCEALYKAYPDSIASKQSAVKQTGFWHWLKQLFN